MNLEHRGILVTDCPICYGAWQLAVCAGAALKLSPEDPALSKALLEAQTAFERAKEDHKKKDALSARIV